MQYLSIKMYYEGLNNDSLTLLLYAVLFVIVISIMSIN